MPVTFGELSTLSSPVSVARLCALLLNCLTFSLAASGGPLPDPAALRTFCVVTWCLFFILTFFIVVIHFIQFHNLLPVSWKNLTATVAALAALMTLAASFVFPTIAVSGSVDPRTIAAAVGSCLASLAYVAEILLIRSQTDGHQRGYMATVPGLLKVLQVFGGCVALVLLGVQQDGPPWRIYVSAATYGVCLLPSGGTVLVMLLDCAGRSPVPFDRLLAAFSLLGVILYTAATVVSFTRTLEPQVRLAGVAAVQIGETAVACITLLAYTVDLAFSIKLLCERN